MLLDVLSRSYFPDDSLINDFTLKYVVHFERGKCLFGRTQIPGAKGVR